MVLVGAWLAVVALIERDATVICTGDARTQAGGSPGREVALRRVSEWLHASEVRHRGLSPAPELPPRRWRNTASRPYVTGSRRYSEESPAGRQAIRPDSGLALRPNYSEIADLEGTCANSAQWHVRCSGRREEGKVSMKKRTMFVWAFTAGLSMVAPPIAQAQDKRVHVSLGGGWTAPNSEVADRLGQGYNFNFGLDVAVNPVVAIEGLYSFNGLGEKQISLPVAPCEGCEGRPRRTSSAT